MRTITRSIRGILITVPENVTLILGNNITLTEKPERTGSKNESAYWGSGVFVDKGGSFEMRDGSVIRDNSGNGVDVLGAFTMSGGTISGNDVGVFIASPYDAKNTPGIFTMSGGTISGNSYDKDGFYGSGVIVTDRATFTMSGGTISGNKAKEQGGGVFIYRNEQNRVGGTFIKTGGTIDGTNDAPRGKAVFYGNNYDQRNSAWVRNSAAGPSENMDTRVSGRQGGWE